MREADPRAFRYTTQLKVRAIVLPAILGWSVTTTIPATPTGRERAVGAAAPG